MLFNRLDLLAIDLTILGKNQPTTLGIYEYAKQSLIICSNALPFYSSRPGRPPKRGPVGLTLPASHISSHHTQLKKHRDDYPYENGHLNGRYCSICENKVTTNTFTES